VVGGVRELLGGDPLQRPGLPGRAAEHLTLDLRGRSPGRRHPVAGGTPHHDPGRTAHRTGAAGADDRVRVPQLRLHLRDDLRRTRLGHHHTAVPGLPAGLRPLQLRPGLGHLGADGDLRARAGDRLRPQHPPGGERIMKRTAGPVAGALKILFVLLYGVPLVWIVLTSLKNRSDMFDAGSAFLFTPETTAYTDVLGPALYQALKQSVLIATGTTALVLLIGVPAAYGLARISGWITSIGLGLLIVLQMLPQTANIIPLFQVFGQWDLLDTTIGVIFADTALLMPFAVMLMRPFFRAVPHELEEASALDGSTRLGTFWRVVL